jgi:hypothetical protein
LNDFRDIAQATGALGIGHLAVTVARLDLRFDLIDYSAFACRFDLGADLLRRPAEAVANRRGWSIWRFETHRDCEVVLTKEDFARQKIHHITRRSPTEAKLILERNLDASLRPEQRT